MSFTVKRIAMWVAALVLASCAAGTPAVAAPGSCRASPVRVSPSAFDVEPFVANPAGTPCVTDEMRFRHVPALGSGLAPEGPRAMTGPVSYGTGNFAYAALTYTTLPQVLFGAASALRSNVTVECFEGRIVASGTSSVGALFGLESPPVQLPPEGVSATIPLGSAELLYVNERIETATSITLRALRLHTPLADIVLAESSAAYDGPCPRRARAPKRARRAR